MPLPGLKSNSFFSTSYFIFIIRFFPSLATTLIMFTLAKLLPETQYGTYQNFWVHLAIFSSLAGFGIPVLLLTYPKDVVVGIFKSLRGQHFLMFSAWVVGCSAAFSLLQAPDLPFWVSFMYMAAFICSLVLESFLMVARTYKLLSGINILYSVLWLVVHWLVIRYQWPIFSVFYGLLVLCLARLVVYVFLAKHHIRRDSTTAGDVQLPVQLRALWLHLGMYDVIQVLSGWGDKFTMSLLLTAAVSAVYFNGAVNIPFLPLLLGAASTSVLLQLSKSTHPQETQKTIQLMNATGRLLSAIVFPIFFYFVIFREQLFPVLFPKYAAAIPVFFMSSLVLPLRAYSFTTVLQRQHKGAIINIGAVAELVLAFALMYPLYLWLGLPGVALSVVASTYCQALFYLYHSAKALGTSMVAMVPLGDWGGKLVIFGVLFFASHQLVVAYFSNIIALILGAGILVISIAVSLVIELKNKGLHGYG